MYWLSHYGSNGYINRVGFKHGIVEEMYHPWWYQIREIYWVTNQIIPSGEWREREKKLSDRASFWIVVYV